MRITTEYGASRLSVLWTAVLRTSSLLAFLGYSPPEGLVFEIFRGNEMPIFTINNIEIHADIEMLRG
jgi:hypothetical protein